MPTNPNNAYRKHKKDDREQRREKFIAAWWKFNTFFAGFVVGVAVYKFLLWRWF